MDPPGAPPPDQGTSVLEGAFESIAYRPYPQYDISLEHLRELYAACDAAAQPERCATFSALFAHGDVVQGAFPEEMPLFD